MTALLDERPMPFTRVLSNDDKRCGEQYPIDLCCIRNPINRLQEFSDSSSKRCAQVAQYRHRDSTNQLDRLASNDRMLIHEPIEYWIDDALKRQYVSDLQSTYNTAQHIINAMSRSCISACMRAQPYTIHAWLCQGVQRSMQYTLQHTTVRHLVSCLMF